MAGHRERRGRCFRGGVWDRRERRVGDDLERQRGDGDEQFQQHVDEHERLQHVDEREQFQFDHNLQLKWHAGAGPLRSGLRDSRRLLRGSGLCDHQVPEQLHVQGQRMRVSAVWCTNGLQHKQRRRLRPIVRRNFGLQEDL